MDPFSHGLSGALLAQSAARPGELRTAALTGAVAAMLVDLDILIQSADDPLLNLDFHRHFTHSLIFIPLGALIATLLLWPLLRRPRWHRGWLQAVSLPRLYVFALLGCATAGLLDAATSYGTHLLWPFSDQRTAWSVIAVVDPLYTLMAALMLVLVLRLRRPWLARLGVLMLLGWLFLGYWQQQRVSEALRDVAMARGHQPERVVVKPTIANLLLWRGLYQTSNEYHVDAYRAGLGPVQHYAGARHPIPDIEGLRRAVGVDSRLAADISRFAFFSDDFLIVTQVPDGSEGLLLGDIRFSLLPDSTQPLWGLVFDPQQPEQPVEFRNFRQLEAEDRAHFLSLLRGR